VNRVNSAIELYPLFRFRAALGAAGGSGLGSASGFGSGIRRFAPLSLVSSKTPHYQSLPPGHRGRLTGQ
jgi:hypothetical protein